MAEKKTTAAASSPSEKKSKKKLRGALLAILVLVLLSAAVIFVIFGAGKVLFERNPRFTLREISITGIGYWKTHQQELASRIKLTPGKDNLFALKLGRVRENIRNIPNVESCSVVRILPDTLKIDITERVPRALINNYRSPWVLDSQAVVMLRSQIMGGFGQLPVITGVRSYGIKPGTELKKLQPALDLIMMTVRSFPDITIYQIAVRNPEKLSVILRYRSFPPCRVFFPVKNRGWSFMLHALQSAIINTRRLEENKNIYDLSFDGKVVVR